MHPMPRSNRARLRSQAPVSTAAFTMAGLGVLFTPAKTGTVLVTLSGYFVTGTGTLTWGIAVQLSHGTGAAPVAGAALTGTQDGSVLQHTNSSAVTAAAVAVPFSIVCVISGLVIGTPIWIDVAQKALTTDGERFSDEECERCGGGSMKTGAALFWVLAIGALWLLRAQDRPRVEIIPDNEPIGVRT
jgi:uncharacterized protein YjeT (DUF2065 family)